MFFSQFFVTWFLISYQSSPYTNGMLGLSPIYYPSPLSYQIAVNEKKKKLIVEEPLDVITAM